MTLSQRIVLSILKPLSKVFLSWKIKGQENIPLADSFILISNHVHLLDPVLLGLSFPRWVRFMAKEELFHYPLLKIIIRWTQAFPVRRQGTTKDKRNVVKQAKDILDNGIILGMFPEGKRSRNGKLTTGKSGSAVIASQAGVPLLPVAITGTDKIKGMSFLWRRPEIVINIGKPFKLPFVDGRLNKSQRKLLTSQLMGEIAALLPPEYQGVYKEHGD